MTLTNLSAKDKIVFELVVSTETLPEKLAHCFIYRLVKVDVLLITSMCFVIDE